MRLNPGDRERACSAHGILSPGANAGAFSLRRDAVVLSGDGRVPSLAIHVIPHSGERLMNGTRAIASLSLQIPLTYKPIDGFFRRSWTQECIYVAHERPSNKNGPAP